MAEQPFRRRMQALISLLSLLVVVAFTIAAWSFYSGHRDACQSRNATLNVLHDILADALASSPPNAAASRFYTTEFTRIAKARCP